MSEKNSTISLSLKSVVVPSKEVTLEYPGLAGFKITLAFLSRETLVGLRKKATVSKFTKGRQIEESLDEELFLQLFANATIKGWSGFKLSYVEQLMPVDLGEMDREKELEFTQENALSVMKNSPEFDSYINSVITDLGNFQTSKKD
jgi:hypothetical protein